MSQLENIKNILKYQFLPFPYTKECKKLKASEKVLNGLDCTPKVVGNTAELPGGYYYTHSVISNLLGASIEVGKFSQNNLTGSDAVTSGNNLTTGLNYLSGAGEEFAIAESKNANPSLTNISYENGDNYEGVKGFQWNLKLARQNYIAYNIKDPKLLLGCFDVEPAVNAALMHAAKDHSVGKHLPFKSHVRIRVVVCL